MGLWDNIKKVAVSAKCMTGWHGGDYEQIEGKEKCKYAKTCPDCGEYLTYEEHKYGNWEYPYGNCQAERKCRYCEDIENEIRHNYRKVGKGRNCRVLEICERCYHEKLGVAEHRWESMYAAGEHIKGKKMCQDCLTVVEDDLF